MTIPMSTPNDDPDRRLMPSAADQTLPSIADNLPLSGGEEAQLARILAALFTRRELQHLTLTEFATPLQNITGGRARLDQALDVVAWAGSRSRSGQLLRAALTRQPTSAALRAFA